MRTAFVFIFSIVCVISIEGRQYCQTNDDCNTAKNECCVIPEGAFLEKGICSEPTAEDSLCDPQGQSESKIGYYTFACPCEKGLSCQDRDVTWGTTKYTVYQCVD